MNLLHGRLREPGPNVRGHPRRAEEWLVGKHETVILGLVYGYVPFLILLFAALDRIDPRVIEAARDLGASPARAFHAVTCRSPRRASLPGA